MKRRVTLISLTVLGMLAVTFVLMGLVPEKEDQVRHVVVFKYQEGATQEQIDKVTSAFRDLQNKIPGIVSFEHGKNVSPEGKDQGFTHVYLMTFEDAAARDAYLPHPDHKKFGEVLRSSGIFEDVFVVDYVPEK